MTAPVQNTCIEINLGSDISEDIFWPSNDTTDGTISGWAFSISDTDNPNFVLSVVDAETRHLYLFMSGTYTALLPSLSGFRIRAVRSDGAIHTTERITIRVS